MLELEQKLIDYSLGILSSKESREVESLIAKDKQVAKLFSGVQDSFCLLGNSARTTKVSDDLKSRVMEICESPKKKSLGFLDKLLPVSPYLPNSRYAGGGGSVDLSDLGNGDLKDKINRLYESMLVLRSLVSGTSSAAEGDLSELCKSAESISLNVPAHNSICSNGVSAVPHEEAIQSFLRTQLTSLPSMGYFLSKIHGKGGSSSDVRRLFYLCRDQMKIMRASFGDLDGDLLADDEKMRLHGAGLLKTKWWGAQHSYYSRAGKVKCGYFFEGPVTERCVEFAEYDSNLYSLANLLGSRSENGEFQIDLDNANVPGCVLATLTATTSSKKHTVLKNTFNKKHNREILNEDNYLVHLVKSSVSRAFKLSTSCEAFSKKYIGCERTGNQTILWFVWPSVLDSQGGGEATTSSPLQ
ncbi:MAG: hypothetical protein HOI70_09330 [Opitutae bacterium]|jgi:hypothetical protein|nr:hypothetical protein [Opitutae bacterium]